MNTSMLLAAQAQGGGTGMILMMVAIFAIFYFFMIRPQQKKQKEIRTFQNSLAEGAKIVTGGGIYGIVKHVDTETNQVEVEIARGTVIRVDKASVFADASTSQTQNK